MTINVYHDERCNIIFIIIFSNFRLFSAMSIFKPGFVLLVLTQVGVWCIKLQKLLSIV